MFVWGKTVIHIIDFSNKNDLPQCLVVFFYYHVASLLDPKPFKQVVAFWFSSTKKK